MQICCMRDGWGMGPEFTRYLTDNGERQLLTQVAYTLPFSFNDNPFQLEWVKYSRNFFQADLTLAVNC